MDGLKTWQKVLMGVALLVLVGSFWLSFQGRGADLPDRITLADISTGETFYIKTGGRRLAILPERNPETGQRSLFPVSKSENGAWVIAPLIRDALEEYEGDISALADRETFEIRVSDAAPKRLD